MKIDIENFPTSGSALRMIDTVTKGFYDRSYTAKWLYQVMGVEVDNLHILMEELPKQIFPETATWGLVYHEQKWQLPVRKNLSYEERRRLIYQKRDCRAPMTPYKMEKYLEDATGFRVHIADINDSGKYNFLPPHPNIFKVFFVGEGTLDLKFIYNILDRLKQSHTSYSLNDRLEAEGDNRNLEQIVLNKVQFNMSIPFWYVYECTLDGSWLLDRSVLLHTGKSYQLMLGIKFYQGAFYTPQRFGLAEVGFIAINRIRERVDAGTGYYAGIHFNFKENTSLYVQVVIHPVQEAVEVVLETKNRNRWFLAGSTMLDGSRNLDSIYKLEEVE